METATLTELDQLVALRCLRDDHRKIGRDILNAACLWADSHPWLGDLFTYPEDDPSVLGVAGEGTPRVDISSVAEFAAAMGLPTKTGVRLIGDALELRHRLPKLWEAVQNLSVSADQARRVAARTTGLSRDDASAVDARLVGFVDRVGAAQLEKLVERVKEQVAPTEPADPRSDDRHFTIVHDTTTASGRSFVSGILDLPDALDLDAAIGDGAALQKFWGNTAPLRVRRAQAAGDLARHQSLLPAPSAHREVANPPMLHPPAEFTGAEPVADAPARRAGRVVGEISGGDTVRRVAAGAIDSTSRGGAVPRRERVSSQIAYFGEPDREIFEHPTPVDAPPPHVRVSSQTAHSTEPDRQIREHSMPVNPPDDPADAPDDPAVTPIDPVDQAWDDDQHAKALAAEQAEHRAYSWRRRLQYPPPEPVLSSGPFRPPAPRQIVLYLHLSAAAITGAATNGREAPVTGDMPADGMRGGSMPKNGARGANMPKNGGCDGSMSEDGWRGGSMPMNAVRGSVLVSDAVGTVGNTLSAVTAAQIREWCAAPGAQVTVRPVIDVNEPASTDSYQPTPRMCEQIQLTNPQCVFPWCAANAIRADLDHIEPWRTPTREAEGEQTEPGDTEAAGGQTHTDNLAPLCRSHHLLKTHYGWRYERTGPTDFTWTSPAGETYYRTGPHTRSDDRADG